MEKIDLSRWERAELFEFFSAVSHPFYSVTFRVDVTNLYRYVKERHLSFYYALGYLVTDAVNSVKNFRYTIRNGEILRLDDLIYISCTPWFDLTGCTNERDFDRDDNIPRITWGRYGEENGRKKLGMSVEVNHRFIDGLHLGKFYEKLQADIDAL